MSDHPRFVAWGLVAGLPTRITLGAWWQDQEAVRAQALDTIAELAVDDKEKDALRQTLIVGTCGAFTEVCLGGKESPVEDVAGLVQDLCLAHLERYREQPRQYKYLKAIADAEVLQAFRDVVPLLPDSMQTVVERMFLLHQALQHPLLGTGLPGDPALDPPGENRETPGE